MPSIDILGTRAPITPFAGLPTNVLPGTRAWVNDATVALTAGIGTVVVGGGANFVPVYYDPVQAKWVIG
jgi:hypothetical protein